MNHLYFLAFAFIFMVGGFSLPPQEPAKAFYDRLPETEFVPWPEKNTARLDGYCS